VAALELSQALSGADMPPQRDQAIAQLRLAANCKQGGLECFARHCDAAPSSLRARARAALAERDHATAAAQMCGSGSDAQAVTVVVRPWERGRGVLSASSAQLLWALFRVCGVVAVSGALSDDEAIDRLRVATARHFATQHVALEAYRAQRKQPREAGAPAPILEGVPNAQHAQCPIYTPMPQCPNALWPSAAMPYGPVPQCPNAQCPTPMPNR